jgi:CDP-6-deoxy-D-xylo-4-hexulose-3-dehydrase
MDLPYPLAADTFGPEEISAAKEVLDSGRLTMGQRVLGFERNFAGWVGAAHAVMVNSGSSANLLMVDAMIRRSGAEPSWHAGDEVLVPALSWPTTAWPLVQLGLVPVFVDVDPFTLAVDLNSARAALTPRTRGVFLIHVLGQTARMDAMLDFCREHRLDLIEDGCESLGSHFAGRHAGTFGRMGSFSFYFSHHLSTIEGGMIVCGDAALADDLRSLRAHGWVRDRSDREQHRLRNPGFDDRFLFVLPGYNVRPTEIQGAVGSVQLRKLDEMLDARERLARTVAGWTKRWAPWLRLVGAEHLAGAGPQGRDVRSSRSHSWMTLPFVVERDDIGVREVTEHLERQRIETRPIIAGNLARHPAAVRYAPRTAPSLANCDRLLQRGFMIGCHPTHSEGLLATLESGFRSLSGAF